MYTGIKHAHAGWAYIVVILMVAAIIFSLYGWLAKKEFGKASVKISYWALIAMHIQLLAGIILYVVSPIISSAFSDFGKAMGTSELRLYAMEHPLIIIIGAVLVTMGYGKAKKKENAVAKHRTIFIFYAIGFLLIASRLPYGAWLGGM